MKQPQVSVGQLLGTCMVIIGIASPAFAVDSSAYTGIWTSQTPALTLKIDTNRAEINVAGKTHTDTSLQYTQNQIPGSPFLYLDTREDSGKQAHQFYLMVSNDDQNQPRLNGYYDHVTLNEAGEKLATESFPLHLQQQQQQAAAGAAAQ